MSLINTKLLDKTPFVWVQGQLWVVRVNAGRLFDPDGYECNRDIDLERKVITIGGAGLTALEAVVLLAEATSEAACMVRCVAKARGIRAA